MRGVSVSVFGRTATGAGRAPPSGHGEGGSETRPELPTAPAAGGAPVLHDNLHTFLSINIVKIVLGRCLLTVITNSGGIAPQHLIYFIRIVIVILK